MYLLNYRFDLKGSLGVLTEW